MSLEHALQALSEAHGPKALARAFAALQSGIKASRRQARQQWGPLVQTYIAAMKIWDAQKAEGVPVAERIAGMEKTLRVAWPQRREWKYLCERCRDLGLEMHECPGDRTCGRDKVHLPHEFGQPCWCSLGARFRDKPKPSPEDFSQAGKSKPMTKVGR